MLKQVNDENKSGEDDTGDDDAGDDDAGDDDTGDDDAGDDDQSEVRARAARRPCEECQACGCPPYCLLNALFLHTPKRERVFCRRNRRGHMYHRPFQICYNPTQPFGFNKLPSIFLGSYGQTFNFF